MHAREENWAVAGIRSLPGLGHFMRDREITVFDTTCFRRFPGNLWKFGKGGDFFGNFFSGRKKREKGIKSFRSFKVFLFG